MFSLAPQALPGEGEHSGRVCGIQRAIASRSRGRAVGPSGADGGRQLFPLGESSRPATTDPGADTLRGNREKNVANYFLEGFTDRRNYFTLVNRKGGPNSPWVVSRLWAEGKNVREMGRSPQQCTGLGGFWGHNLAACLVSKHERRKPGEAPQGHPDWLWPEAVAPHSGLWSSSPGPPHSVFPSSEQGLFFHWSLSFKTCAGQREANP